MRQVNEKKTEIFAIVANAAPSEIPLAELYWEDVVSSNSTDLNKVPDESALGFIGIEEIASNALLSQIIIGVAVHVIVSASGVGVSRIFKLLKSKTNASEIKLDDASIEQIAQSICALKDAEGEIPKE